MEHLDRKESCEFTLIGGNTCDLQRAPSSLMASSSPTPKPYSILDTSRCLHCQLKTKKKRRGELRSSSSNEETRSTSSNSSSSSPDNGGVILRWDEEDIMAWLSENDFSIYEVRSLCMY